MSGPRIYPVESLGDTFSKAVGGIAETLQTVAEQRRQQQQDALRQLLTQTQIQSEQASTERTQAATAEDRQRLAAEQRKQRETQMDEDEYQRAMGIVLAGYAAGNGDIGSQQYQQAVGRAVAGVKRPGAGTLLHNRLTQFVGDINAPVTAQADLQKKVADAQTAVTNAHTAAVEAPSRTAAARALDRWYAQNPNAPPMDMYMTQLRASLQRHAATADNNAQADLAQRQVIVGAYQAARAAKAKDDELEPDATKRHPLSAYLADQASSIIDPTTGQPLKADELMREAGRMVRNIPKVPNATGNASKDAAQIRTVLPALRRAGFDDAGAREYLRSIGYR